MIHKYTRPNLLPEKHTDPEDVEGDGVYCQPPLRHCGADCLYFIEGVELIVKLVIPPNKEIQPSVCV